MNPQRNNQSNGYGSDQQNGPRVNDANSVQSYASDITGAYRLESLEEPLEVHTGQQAQPSAVPQGRGIRFGAFFSRRKAMVVSTLITALVLLLTIGAMAFLVRQGPDKDKENSQTTTQQDIKIEDSENSKIPAELQGAQQSLLVSGDIITRGSLKISDNGFVTIIRVQDSTDNQIINLPGTSGTVCLDTNNCGYATQESTDELQGQLGALQSQLDDLSGAIDALSQVTIPPAGVTDLNEQTGSVSLQGSVNRIDVSTADGVVTITTPQDLDSNANVQFGNLTLSAPGQIRANTLVQTSAGNSVLIDAGSDMITFVAGGLTFQLPTTGGAVQTICTTGATCATGSGTAVILSPGAAQLDGTANSSIFINDTGGGNLIHLQSGGVDRFTISNAGNTTVGGSLTISGLGNGFVRSTGGTLGVVTAIDLAADVTGILPVANGGTGSNTANGARGNLGAAGSGANADITSTTALNTITPSAALTIGTPLQQFTLQGAGNSSISAGSGANVTTLAFAAPSGANTITFPALTGTVCISTGNCAAAGTAGGDLTGSYPNPTIARLQGANLNITGSANGQILVYNGANSRWENASVSGDITLSGTGTATIAANAVTTGKIADSNVTNAKLQNSSLTVTSGSGLLSGGAVSLGGSTTLNIGQGDGITVNTDDIAVDNTVCRTTGNCAGVGGNGDISGTGSANRLVMFNGAKSVTTSTLLQSAGSLTLDSGNNFVLTSGNLMLSNGNVDVTGGGNFTGTVSGADAVQNDEFVTLSQLNDAVGGVGGGVDSLNSLEGDLSLQGTAGQITINDNGTDTITLSLNTAVTLQGNTFNGVNQLVRLGASGELPVLNASNLTDLNASNLASGTVPSGRITGSYTGITGLGTVTTGTWNGNAVADTYVQDNITISNLGSVDWTALNNYPAACPAGQAVTQLGDTITCSVFAAGSGSGNYIQNQSASAQTSASFWIDGSGQANSLSASTLTSTVATGTAPFTVASTTVVANLNADSLDGQDGSYYLNIGNATGTLNIARIADGSIGNAKLTNSSLTVTAGGGLINGGNIALGGTATLNIGQGDGITVNADDIAVDSTVCRTTGNCDAAPGTPGSGDITGGGTANRVALFSANKNIVDSYLLQSAGVLTLDNGTDFVLAGGDISVTGNGSFTGTVSGADAVQNDEFVTLSQLNDAVGGVGGGVTSLNTLDGALDLQGTAGQITVADNGTDTITLSLNAAVTLQGNSFNGPDQLVQLTNTGILPVLNGSNLTNVNAALLQGQNGAYYLDLGNATGTLNIARIADTSITNAKLVNDSVTITAGNGLTDGGTTALGGTNTLNIGAGDGITVNANDVAVDATVARLNANANFTANLQQGGNDVCTVAGNCDAAPGTPGSGDITGTGTAGRLAVFDATKNIVNSYLQQSAGTLTLDTATNFVLTAGNLTLTSGNLGVTGSGTFSGTVTATSFIGSGASLTSLNANEITSGTVASARISGQYTGITGVGTVTVGTWNGTAISDAYIQDNITISSAGTVDWTALSNYPSACPAGSAITQLGDTISCQAFATGGDGGITTVGAIDSQTKSANGAVISGVNLYLQTADASNPGLVSTGNQTFAGNKTFNGSVVVAASQSLTITGGNTASRPGSPTEGMVYFDTTTKQLLVYANGKWQADRSEAILVAASNSSQADKDAADYVADGNTVAAADGDQIQINAALTAATGKKVVLLAGTYVSDETILIPNNTVLAGVGNGTVIELADLDATENLIEATGANRTSQVVRDMKLDGRGDLNNAGTQNGISFTSTGSSSLAGAQSLNVTAVRFDGTAILFTSSVNGFVTGNLTTTSTYGIVLNNTVYTLVNNNISRDNNNGANIRIESGSARNTITGNISQATGGQSGINLNAASANTVSANTVYGSQWGIRVDGSSTNNTITGNTVQNNSSAGILITSANNNIVSGNKLHDNGDLTLNNAVSIGNDGDNNTITGNSITDSFATTTNYAINISSAGADNNYLADNTLGGGTINDLGTGTIYGGQTNSTGNFMIQPTGTIELLKNTNITGTLNVTGDVDTNGSLTVGNANQFVISNLGVVTSGTWQGTAITDTYVANTLTVDSASTVDWQALNNYPAACSAGQAITQLGDTITCGAFSTGGSGVTTIGAIDSQTKSANGAVISGVNLYLQTADASNPGLVSTGNQTFAGDKTFNGQIGVANGVFSGGTSELQDLGLTSTLTVDGTSTFKGDVILDPFVALRVTGGNTASRPASPTEGMIYFDTTTKQLLTYANGKWQADRSTATKIIAPSNASDAAKASADVVLTGTADQTLINTALTAAAGGKVYLMEGTITLTGSISIPNNTTLVGAGNGTLITIPNSHNAALSAIINTDQVNGTGIVIQDLRIDGNKANQTSGAMTGIDIEGIGTGGILGIKIANVSVSNWRNSGLYAYEVHNSSISNSTFRANTGRGLSLSESDNNVATGNISQNNSIGIDVESGSDYNTITSNVLTGNVWGIETYDNTNNTFTGNTIKGNTSYGIDIDFSSSNGTISGNTFHDNGGATLNNAIRMGNGSTRNTVTGNTITDTSCTSTCFAIIIGSSITNYLSGNNLGTNGTISDGSPTTTVYGGQTNGSGNFVIQSAGTVELMKNTNVTGTLNVTGNFDTNGSLTVGNANQFVISNTGVVTSGTWQAGTIGLLYGGTNNTTYTTNGIVYSNGTSLVSTAAGTTGQCLLATTGGAPTWNSCTASDLQGTYNASSPATILLTDNKSFTVNTNDTATDSNIIFNLSCATCSANGGRFAVQDAGTDVFTVNPNGDILIGNSTNGILLAASANYKFEAKGTARNSKTVRLSAEYPSAVLDAGTGGSNTGTMTSGYDFANRTNYYNWTTTQPTSQSYDVVVQVPIPKDFGEWDNTSSPLKIHGYKLQAGGTVSVQVIKSNGSADSNFATFQALSIPTTNTWSLNNLDLDSTNYTAGDYLTLRIRLAAGTNEQIRVGNITLNYLSKF